jgi:gas vesicle protein
MWCTLPATASRTYGNLSVAAALQTDDLLAIMKGGWSMNAVRYWAVFSLGVAAGAAAALIYAPQTGEKTRKQLKRHLEDASDYIKDASDDLSKHATKVYQTTIDRASDVASRVSSVAGNVSSAASNIADKVGDLV